MDNLTKEQRHKNMQHIRCRDTHIEVILRKALWRLGIRYRKNFKALIGRPDIVITKYKIVIFCDSDFWHGRNLVKIEQQIKSNRQYWIPKIKRNIERDIEVNDFLTQSGWVVLRFWETDINANVDNCINTILSYLP